GLAQHRGVRQQVLHQGPHGRGGGPAADPRLDGQGRRQAQKRRGRRRQRLFRGLQTGRRRRFRRRTCFLQRPHGRPQRGADGRTIRLRRDRRGGRRTAVLTFDKGGTISWLLIVKRDPLAPTAASAARSASSARTSASISITKTPPSCAALSLSVPRSCPAGPPAPAPCISVS